MCAIKWPSSSSRWCASTPRLLDATSIGPTDPRRDDLSSKGASSENCVAVGEVGGDTPPMVLNYAAPQLRFAAPCEVRERQGCKNSNRKIANVHNVWRTLGCFEHAVYDPINITPYGI